MTSENIVDSPWKSDQNDLNEQNEQNEQNEDSEMTERTERTERTEPTELDKNDESDDEVKAVVTPVTNATTARKGPRRRQPPHYREIRSRVQTITDKFLPILGEVALGKVGQLRIDELSGKINNVYGDLVLLRRFLEQDSPDDISLSNNNILTPVPGSLSPFQMSHMQLITQDEDGHSIKRQRTDESEQDDMIRPAFQGIIGGPNPDLKSELTMGSTTSSNPNLPSNDIELHVPVVSSYRALPHSSRPSYESGVMLLNEKRREKLWAVMQQELQNFAVGYSSTPLRTTEDFCALAYAQDGRMKRTLKNDLAISEALYDGISGFRKRLYQTNEGENGQDTGLNDCGIRTYTNNLYNLKIKPQNYYHFLFAAAFWRWVRDEIDAKTVVSNGGSTQPQTDFAVNSVEDWWRECVGICNGFLKTNSSRPEKKAFLKDRLLADEKKYADGA
ncbi:hypothetical protein V1512DRAFT_265354 [Lipomyces arxii]|uniref:uncharacterized protein n=1 Tax=Lipomyces arxii TaxID=56418 RepID=UPI0034CD43DD